jgi:hypothetical protein
MAADAPATIKVGDLTFKRPVEWESVPPPSPMRKAQLRVRGEKDQSADVIFFHFGGGDGGGTQANIDRWLAQFKEAHDNKVTNEKVGGHKVVYVSTKGTYSGGMPGQAAAALPNYALLGAIIESDGGNVFVKMTGPEKVVSAADKNFREMIASVGK